MIKFISHLVILCIPFMASAENNLSVLIHGSSLHSGCIKGQGKRAKTCDFNTFNPGLGLDWALIGNSVTGKLSVRTGTYYDSLRDMAYYVGAAYNKEWNISPNFTLGIGIQAGYLNGSGENNIVALPMISLGYKQLSLEVGYAPKSGWGGKERRSNVTLFTLKWQL
ncbi:MAG: hypothetical protein ACRC53_11225 [Plesiomonas sp.]|uniref:hypothetical protein n=1 Tax=Plesiomonas sp. TaxID=2486279 RepID=UPI003F302B67